MLSRLGGAGRERNYFPQARRQWKNTHSCDQASSSLNRQTNDGRRRRLFSRIYVVITSPPYGMWIKHKANIFTLLGTSKWKNVLHVLSRAYQSQSLEWEKENSHFTMWIVDSRVKQRFIFASFLLLYRAMLFRFNICPLACSHLMSHFVDVRNSLFVFNFFLRILFP